MTAFYSEFDPFAAAWLRELQKAGVISEGPVDERSIEDVTADDIRGHRRCHFFSGIGVWDYALQLAGFPTEREVWTGSCPCQSFSSAGKRAGFADERHLWPAWFHLISECRPQLLFGEQVASGDALAWLDLVCADLEGCGYTVGSVVTPAAGFGAPHGRHRIYWCAVADPNGNRTEGNQRGEGSPRSACRAEPRGGGIAGPVANTGGVGRDGRAPVAGRGEVGGEVTAGAGGECAGLLDDALGGGLRGGGHGAPVGSPTGARGEVREQRVRSDTRPASGVDCAGVALGDSGGAGLQGCNGEELPRAGRWLEGRGVTSAGATNGFWGNAIWLPCTDGKARAVEPGAFPMVDELASDLGLVRLASYPDRPHEERVIYAPLIQKGKARKGRLKGYGNAVVLWQAVEFIRAFLQAEAET